MSSLSARLRDYARREATFADVRSECIRIAGGDASVIAQGRRQLAKALEAGTLTSDQFARLEAVIQSMVLADGGSVDSIPEPADRTDIGAVRGRPAAAAALADEDDGDDEVTLLRSHGGEVAAAPERDDADDDTTLLRPRPPTGGSASAQTTDADADADDDPTVLRPGSGAGGQDGAGHDLATAAEVDDDTTVLRPPPTARGRSTADDADDDVSEDITVRPGASVSGDDETLADEDEDTTVVMPSRAAGDEDATVVLPRVGSPADHDATGVMQPSGSLPDDDATLVTPSSDVDATVVNSGDITHGGETGDRTRVLGQEEFDILDPDAMAAAERAGTDSSVSDATWDPAAPTQRGPVVDREFKQGSVLKERFRLIEALGEGGMGTVWKAVDTLKLEAEDRNPYVAIKLLQGDFKAHPEAFIALQRESSKQQRLAHPNIATVFDFDREASSNTVFMTMEVMEGSDLADYIKSLPPEGLPYDEAMELIEQLGAGLDYAHKAGLVHSDLKPGNCFLTNDKKVKLLDFGIARASATREDAEGEETKFDPGQLGALTPSYATIEMFNGLEPDPRDDIYAMAIIAYQLLTAKHPYNRRAAPKAMAQGLTVEPVDKLTKRQNRALAQGLEFLREARTGSVEEFLEGLRVKKHNKALLALPFAVVLGIAGAAYKPVMDYLDEREVAEIVEQVRPADVSTIQAVVQSAMALDDESQRERILGHETVTRAVLALFEQGGEARIREGLAAADAFPEAHKQRLLGAGAASKAVVQLALDGAEQSIRTSVELAAQFPENERRAIVEDKRVTDAVVAILARGDEASIRSGLELAALFPPNEKRRILEDPRVTEAVVSRIAGGDEASIAQGIRLAGLFDVSLQSRILGHERVADTLIARIQSGDEQTIRSGLALLDQFPGGLGAPIRENQATVDAVISFYSARMWSDFEPAQQRYDLKAAESTLERLTALYPKRGEVRDVADELYARRDAEVERLRTRLQSLLAAAEQTPQTTLLPVPDAEDVGDVLERVRQLNPNSDVLEDPAIGETYRRAASAAIAESRYTDAERLLAAGLSFAPQSDELARLSNEVLAELKRIEDARVAAQIEARLAPQWQSITSLPQFEPVREDMLRLAEVAPDSEMLAAMQRRLRGLLDREFARHVSAGRVDEAQSLLLGYARLLDLEYLTARKQQLADAGVEPAAPLAETAAREQRLQTLLASPEATREWRNALAIAFKELLALSALDAPAVASLRERIAAMLEAEAEEAVQRDEYARAERALVQAGQYYPGWSRLEQARSRVAQAKAEFERVRAEQERIARIEALKAQVLAAAVDNQPLEAVSAFEALRTELPADDTFMLDEGSQAIGRSFARAAAVAASQGEAEQAIALVEQGMRIAPRLAELEQARVRFIAQLEERALQLQPVMSPALRDTGELPPRSRALVAPPVSEGPMVQPGSRTQLLSPIARAPELREPLQGATGVGLAPGRRPATAAPLALQDEFGREVAQQLLARLDDSPAAIDAARVPLEAFAAIYPQASAALRAEFAARFQSGIVALAASDGAGSPALTVAVASYKQLFPGNAAALEAALDSELSAALLASARSAPLQAGALEQPFRDYVDLLPAMADGLRARLAEVLLEGIAAAAPANLEGPVLAEALDSVARLTPAAQERVRERVAAVVRERVLVDARQAPDDMQLMASRMASLRPLLPPVALTALVAELAQVSAAHIGDSLAGDAADIRPVAERIASFRKVFGASGEAALRERIAQPAAQRMLAMLSAQPDAVAALQPLLGAFANAFPAEAAPLRAQLSADLGEALRAGLRDRSLAVGAVVAAVQAARQTFSAEAQPIVRTLMPAFEERLERDVREAPRDLEGIGAGLEHFAALYTQREPAVRERLSAPVMSAIQGAYRTQVPALARVGEELQRFKAVFPTQIDTLRARLSGAVAASVLSAAQAKSTELVEAQEAVAGFRELFPAQADALRADVAQVLWGAIERQADKSAGKLDGMAQPLAAFKGAFPDEYTELSVALAVRVAREIQRGARDTRVQLTVVASMLEQFRALFPSHHADVAQDVGGALAERISNRKLDGAADVEAIAPALRELATLFPERQATLVAELTDKVVKRVRSQEQSDPRAAHALQQAALKAFPDSAELRSIRIELPLEEIIAARGLLKRAQLTGARKLLADARRKDPTHSTIAPFEAALEAQEAKAREAYKRYQRVVKTSRQTREHRKAFQAVRVLWADNAKEFKSLEPPAPNACTTTKAGKGGRHVCFDKIGRRRSDIGPQMVVVPAGRGIDAPFAISKFEISVNDYARYCRQSKACTPPRLKRTLPMHNIGIAEIDAYAAWLSKIGETVYRLPTSAEWRYAASANGRQPKRDFNCTVLVGNQQLKGLSLLSVKSGKENGWGLVNYIGNVRELVRDGAVLTARGGSYKDKLQNCNIDLSTVHDGEADAITGFRLVRDVVQ